MSSTFPPIPPEYEHPVDVLARELHLKRRSDGDRPHTLLRVLLFALPFTVAYTLGPLVMPKDLALTVGSALLGVQLARPYTRWSNAFVRFFDMAREEHQHPVRFATEMFAQYGLHNRTIRTQLHFTPEFNKAGEPVGLRVHDIGKVGANRTVARAWFRLRLEPAWRRYFVDLDPREISLDGPQGGHRVVTQCSDLVAQFPMRWRHKGWTGRCYYVLGVFTLWALGRNLREVAVRPNADASVITIARQLGVPYLSSESRWNRIKFRLRFGWDVLTPRGLRRR